jgi:CTP:molybdopterin cytidylyltransferase MocA
MARFGAVILAAGMSRRMGQSKALLRLGAQTVIQRIAATAAAGGADPLIVVTGHAPQTIRDALRDQPDIEFVHNPGFDAGGMRSSVQVGVAAVAARCDAFFLMLLDQPLIKPRTLREMAARWEQRKPPILMPAHHSSHGHPLLIASTGAAEIAALAQDATLHDFVHRHRSQIDVIEVTDRGVVTDLDTPDDYRAMNGNLINEGT